MKHQSFREKLLVLSLAIAIPLLSGCAIGYHDDATWSSSVKGAQLESPSPSDVTVVDNLDGTATIKWPVVPGAGGYEFTFYNVDDPENPVAVGEANEVVDGCKVSRDITDDTKYMISIRTLGNAEWDNKDATTACEADYATLVPTTGTIPSGTDIFAWFEANPITPTEAEQAFVLEPGGEYTISDVLNFGGQLVTFRGDKINHAKVTMLDGSRISTCTGLKVKFIDFDCSASVSSSSSNALILLGNNPADYNIFTSGGWNVIADPIVLQECNITGINRYLIAPNATQWCVKTFMVRDCVVGINQSTDIIYMNQNNSFIAHLQLMNSTFYSTVSNGNRFIRYSSRGPRNIYSDGTGWTGVPALYNGVSYLGGVIVQSCTFYNIAKTSEMANYSGMNQTTTFFNIQNSIFVDSGNNQVIRRFIPSSGRPMLVTNNAYWFNGAFTTDSSLSYDTAPIETDPQLADPANGDFTPSGDALARRAGDPRWLPELPE
ncbi:MAG: DUF4957 domain-containing protein [Mediterranea sp.]|jgi:hypothetical protein|nr:DUF4957 domain-containing protein [Mediterranea sp.]